jgi:4-amino-4-deoxy-L-arabinose transferase-like glycosyltransferase
MTTGEPAPHVGARPLVAIFLIALGVRLAVVVATGAATARFGDALSYQHTARALAETGRYPRRTDAFYTRPPGYSAFLAVVTLGHPERVVLAKVANAALGGFSAVLLAAIAARLFRSRLVAIGAGVAAALDPSLVMVSSDVQSEPLFLLLLLGAGFLLLVATDRPSSGLALTAGLFTGLAVLTRPSALLVAPLLAAPLADRRWPRRVRVHLAVAGLCGALAALAPWTIRNAVVYREFVLVSDVGGFNFYLGNSDLMLRFYEIRDRQRYNVWSDETDRLLRDRWNELRAAGLTSPGAITRALVRQTVGDALARPATTARLLLHKVWDWLRPYPNPMFWPLSVVLGVGALYSILYLCAARGLWIAPRRGASLFAVAFLLASMLAHVATFVSWRYRVPYWDPVLVLYGVFGAGGTLAARWKQRT